MPGGFTLVELLVVIVVLAILAALLLPAINAAMRTAKNAAVSAEINQLAQALEQFKSKFGDYPPSRVLLVENGNYTNYINSNASMSSIDAASPGTGDITVGQLATRTLTAFRKFWPRVQLSTNGSSPPNLSTSFWYDFNGNGTLDGAYVLHGHECLVFFLGGVPVYDVSSGGYGMTGLGTDPTNPFINSILGNSMYNPKRQTPYFEFNAGRLFLDPTNHTTPGIPGYYDTLGSQPPLNPTGTESTNFYAYFSANGNGNYDPNDVNFLETDNSGSTQPIELQYTVGFYTFGSTSTPYTAISPSPNPYTSTQTAGTTSGTITYQKPQSFQIISSGIDGMYGVGGQYQATTTSATVSLPLDVTHTINTSDASIRQREYDNVSNFKSGTLD
jgi:prepilin-type N-terminal cleavage/methylation domain-containing protein